MQMVFAVSGFSVVSRQAVTLMTPQVTLPCVKCALWQATFCTCHFSIVNLVVHKTTWKMYLKSVGRVVLNNSTLFFLIDLAVTFHKKWTIKSDIISIIDEVSAGAVQTSACANIPLICLRYFTFNLNKIIHLQLICGGTHVTQKYI